MKTRLLLAATAAVLLVPALPAAERKPNLLFIYTDDQRWDALGVVQREQGEAARFPWFKTPNMDRIAAEGVRFRNAFVTLSLCAPSRAAFLTGRYNHNNGVIDNHTPFPTDSVTHASLMRAAGYKTAYIGYYLGEHGLGDKRSMYEESLRVPMLVRYPKLFPKGKTCDDLVLNIDLAPTFLDLAGVPAPEAMQGKSWVPLLTGRKTDWRQSVLTEYFFERGFEGTPTVVGIRTTKAKWVKYPGHEEWTEWFNLPVDRYETNNLISSTSANELRQQLMKEFDLQVKATGYHEPAGADKPGAGGAGPKLKKGKKQNQPQQ